MEAYVVTGANRGVGLAIARDILQSVDDSFVFLGCRKMSRGEEAVNVRRFFRSLIYYFQQLCSANQELRKRLKVINIDVSNKGSVEQAVSVVLREVRENPKVNSLKAVINNAGIDGDFSMKQILQVNVYGVYNVCKSFIPYLKEGASIVNISSAAGPAFVAQCNKEYKQLLTSADVQWQRLEEIIQKVQQEFDNQSSCNEHLIQMGISKESSTGKFIPYQFSKAMCNSLTLILAKENPQLRINACTPGFTATDMTLNLFADGDLSKGFEMGMQNVNDATRSTLRLLTMKEASSGFFYDSNGEISALSKARDGY